MIFLWNATGEDFDFQYGGLSYTIAAGKRMRVQEAMGNHALNALGPRGLTRLIFDDDGKSINEDKIEADAKERNREFKIKQIYTYNERNERRKASGQAYDPPTAAVKQYAVEMGIDLLQPYTMAQEEKGQIAKLTRESELKDLQIAELRAESRATIKLLEELKAQVAGGFVKAKDVVKETTVKCDVCGEEVMASRMRSHMIAKHKGD